MKRTEPPQFATRMLEHCTPADRHEVLSGDLLEEFRSGRSEAWYWRQVFAACAVSWTESLRARIPLFVFALIWSMLAPAWKVFIDGIESAPIIDRILDPLGILGAPPLLAGWLLLNGSFLWAGMLVYILTLSACGKVFRRNEVRRPFLLVPFVYAWVFGAWTFLCMLDWTTPFENGTFPATPLGQITGLGALEDAMRIPYIIALLAVFWNVIPRSKHAALSEAEMEQADSAAQSDPVALIANFDPFAVKRFFALMVGAGVINAMIAGFLLCGLPESHSPTLTSLLIRAVIYVAVGALAGVGGAWIYWKNPASPFRENPPIPFPHFALVCATAWVWVPCMIIFSEQVSPAAALVAMTGALILANGLRSVTASVFVPAQHDTSYLAPEEAEIFAESLYRAPHEVHGYLIAICVYAAGCALATRSNLTAAALLALGAFLFAWKRTFVQDKVLESSKVYKRGALRLALIAIPAVLVTIWALLDGVAHRNHLAEVNMALADNGTSANDGAQQKATDQASTNGVGGYESVILWPLPEKKQIIPPLTAQESLLAPGTTRPLIIPFDGPYWYIQPPNENPGPKAHQARGTPLGADIESSNSVPLTMEAHQTLGTAIHIARCREIQVGIENRDNKAGLIAIAVLLTDTASPEKPALYLGQQPIVSTEPEHFSFKTMPASETLYFAVPESTKIRKFNEINVMLLSDVEHALIAPKIAIRQFKLFPR